MYFCEVQFVFFFINIYINSTQLYSSVAVYLRVKGCVCPRFKLSCIQLHCSKVRIVRWVFANIRSTNFQNVRIGSGD